MSCGTSLSKFSFGVFPSRYRVRSIAYVKVLDVNYNTKNTLLSILYVVVLMESEVFSQFL